MIDTLDITGLVLAGGRGSRLYELTQWRAKPAVYFGGKFRIIDFPLSNCVNSGITRIGVLTQYKAHSLIRHLIAGWGNVLSRELGGGVEILPASQRTSDDWYAGTADAILHPFSGDGSRYMEYVRDRGRHADFPFDEVLPAILAAYPAFDALDAPA